jgi:hypothetical protein
MSGKSTAERLKEQAARRKERQGRADDAAPQETPRPRAAAAPVHAKPIRSTVDLPPHQHASMKAWCNETAVMVGRARVTTQDVVRALIGRLLTDETLARKIREDLRTD